jgi:hypothetical protein
MLIVAYPIIGVTLLGLWLCVVAATRQAEVQKKASDPQFPTVQHASQISSYAGGMEMQPGNVAAPSGYQGQTEVSPSLGAPQYQQAFGSARSSTDLYSDSVPASGTSFPGVTQFQNQQCSAKTSSPLMSEATPNSLSPFRHRQFDMPGELAKPTDEAMGSMANYGTSGGYPVYGGASAQFPQATQGGNYQQPLAGLGQGNSDNGLNPHRMAPRVVVVGR